MEQPLEMPVQQGRDLLRPEPPQWGFMVCSKRDNNQETWIQPKETLNGKTQLRLASGGLTLAVV